MGAMTLSATREWDFSSEQGKANYKAAQRRYPAQAIVDLAALRDNMRHLVSVVGGPHSGTAVMGIVKADAYGHGLIPAALAALDGWCAREGMLFAFDPCAYEVTSSKLRSRDLFLRCGTPIPHPAARRASAPIAAIF